MKVRNFAGVLVLVGALTACASGNKAATGQPSASPSPAASASASATPAAPTGASPIVVEGAWVRGTDGSKNPSMTGAFMHLSNPTDKEITLVRAENEQSGKTELHEMAMVEGKMVMREVAGGIKIPAGGLADLGPGGLHVMLMDLKRPLKVGEELTIKLHFSDGSSIPVMAPVKAFAEEEDHYHGPSSSGAPKMSMSGHPSPSGSTSNG